jgi:hypothetical protein
LISLLEQPVETLATEPRLDLYIALSNNMLRLKSGVGQITSVAVRALFNQSENTQALRDILA